MSKAKSIASNQTIIQEERVVIREKEELTLDAET